MKPEQKENIDEAMRQLTSTLRAELTETGLVTTQQWNEGIAPKLAKLALAVDDVSISARTYRIPDDAVTRHA